MPTLFTNLDLILITAMTVVLFLAFILMFTRFATYQQPVLVASLRDEISVLRYEAEELGDEAEELKEQLADMSESLASASAFNAYLREALQEAHDFNVAAVNEQIHDSSERVIKALLEAAKGPEVKVTIGAQA